jgi:hypothetical protein
MFLHLFIEKQWHFHSRPEAVIAVVSTVHLSPPVGASIIFTAISVPRDKLQTRSCGRRIDLVPVALNIKSSGLRKYTLKFIDAR